MSDIKITPHPLAGTVTPPASKSDAHRAIICAALAPGVSRIENITMSDDICATIDCLAAMGASFSREGGALTVSGGKFHSTANLDCGESGSTLRFLLPVAAAAGVSAVFNGKGRLPGRPIDTLLELISGQGCTVTGSRLPVKIQGRLSGGKFMLPGNISSQYITGLLLALPLCGGGEIVLTSPLESAGYVDMTISTMGRFGVDVEPTSTGYRVGKNGYKPVDYTVEGDWSSAAFPLAAGVIGGEIKVKGLNPDSLQGDSQIIRILQEFGGNVRFESGAVCACKSRLRGISIDASQIPDMIPALAAVAACAKGDTVIHSAGRLRIKESDRLAAIAEALTAFGISNEEGGDSLIIHGGQAGGCRVDGKNDHRIVMAFAVLATCAKGDTVITGCEAAGKSYPAFFDDFKKMGGICHVL